MILPADMRFVQNFTPPDFQAKTFTPSISPNFKGFIDKKQTTSLNGEIYTAGTNFTPPPAVAAGTNLNSAFRLPLQVPTGSQIYIKSETVQTSNIPEMCLKKSNNFPLSH